MKTPSPPHARHAARSHRRVAEALPDYHRVSVGFPGIVVDGVVYTAPNLGTLRFRGARLAAETRRRLGRPARVVNDAEMHAYGVIGGAGVEVVLDARHRRRRRGVLRRTPGPEFALTTLPPHTPGALGRARASADLGNAARKRRNAGLERAGCARDRPPARAHLYFDRLFLGVGTASG